MARRVAGRDVPLVLSFLTRLEFDSQPAVDKRGDFECQISASDFDESHRLLYTVQRTFLDCWAEQNGLFGEALSSKEQLAELLRGISGLQDHTYSDKTASKRALQPLMLQWASRLMRRLPHLLASGTSADLSLAGWLAQMAAEMCEAAHVGEPSDDQYM